MLGDIIQPTSKAIGPHCAGDTFPSCLGGGISWLWAQQTAEDMKQARQTGREQKLPLAVRSVLNLIPFLKV